MGAALAQTAWGSMQAALQSEWPQVREESQGLSRAQVRSGGECRLSKASHFRLSSDEETKAEVAAEPANGQPFPLRVTAAVTTEESGQVLGIPWEEEGKGVSRSSLKAHRKPHTLRLQQ